MFPLSKRTSYASQWWRASLALSAAACERDLPPETDVAFHFATPLETAPAGDGRSGNILVHFKVTVTT